MLTAENLMKVERQERRERLRITLVMIGSGLLRRNTEGGVGSEEPGVGGSVAGGQRTVKNAQR